MITDNALRLYKTLGYNTELLKDSSAIDIDDQGVFKQATIKSVYYKAILQNLFFASLNCPIEPSRDGDNRQRGFRLKDNYAQNRGAHYLMRYEDQFKNPKKFLELINTTVPFLNGGLFECLDNKEDKLYIDGFSDNLAKPHQLIVPDYLFFGFDRDVDLSEVIGINTYKKTNVKGLVSILKSYKFTITENTPIEEDVALDPELLGKVFENLLASYNPETKITARKQTGSFYTPREIINYMVDESLTAYLKNQCSHANTESEHLEQQLHELLAYNAIHPFANDQNMQQRIIEALDNCKILDPACGSGAFPMGILHKMVHILQKIDPENKYWQELQLTKAVKETEGAFALKDKKEREQKLIEINEAFDEKINNPDYARKLFLIENCIYGVDIQPIATQISKLRFFISLIVDQKVDKTKPNFGIRALPNLETKFVAANTLIGIHKPQQGDYVGTPFDNPEIKQIEKELKTIRHRLFSAKSPETKRRLRDKDKEVREKIGTLLVEYGWGNETAKQLASWDPYNQNTSSPFFDAEWMFGIKDGFDVVIGNPPYGASLLEEQKKYFKQNYISAKTISGKQKGSLDSFTIFIEHGFNSLTLSGNLIFIVPISITSGDSMSGLHKLIENNCETIKISSYSVRPQPVFENAVVNTSIIFFHKNKTKCKNLLLTKMYRKNNNFDLQNLLQNLEFANVIDIKLRGRYPKISYPIERNILLKIFSQKKSLLEIQKDNGEPIYYRTTGGRYFKVITTYSTGSTQEKAIFFDKDIVKFIGALLSTNLFFWYYQIYSDNLHIKAYDINSFTFPNLIIIENKKDIEEIYEEYLKDIEINATVRQTKQYANIESFKEYKISKSKKIIDRLDDLIGPLYGLSKEEITFLKNYEIEFRLSSD
ncbi:MAG: N-6 DNA methylase, partial [Desulfobacterales bacterium]|nr:N-6 DNA methylase [Desulfobacterales bacterium]